MKHIKGLVLILSLITAVGCKQEYSCTCTDDQTGEVTNVSIYQLSEQDAISACNNADEEAGVSCVLDDN